MYDAIWEVAEEQHFEEDANYVIRDLDGLDDLIPGWEDMSTAELVDEIRKSIEIQDWLFAMDAVPGLAFDISYLEEVMTID